MLPFPPYREAIPFIPTPPNKPWPRALLLPCRFFPGGFCAIVMKGSVQTYPRQRGDAEVRRDSGGD